MSNQTYDRDDDRDDDKTGSGWGDYKDRTDSDWGDYSGTGKSAEAAITDKWGKDTTH